MKIFKDWLDEEASAMAEYLEHVRYKIGKTTPDEYGHGQWQALLAEIGKTTPDEYGHDQWQALLAEKVIFTGCLLEDQAEAVSLEDLETFFSEV